MVGSSRPGAWQTSSSRAPLGGSSRTFSRALAALRFISSALSMTTIRQPPSAEVRRRKFETSRTSSTTISPRIFLRLGSQPRSTVRRSAWPPAEMRRATGWDGSTRRSVGAATSPNSDGPASSAPPPASSQRAKRKASVALPMPRGPPRMIACGSRPAVTAWIRPASATAWPNSSGLRRGARGSTSASSPFTSPAAIPSLVPPHASGRTRPQGRRDWQSRHVRLHEADAGGERYELVAAQDRDDHAADPDAARLLEQDAAVAIGVDAERRGQMEEDGAGHQRDRAETAQPLQPGRQQNDRAQQLAGTGADPHRLLMTMEAQPIGQGREQIDAAGVAQELVLQVPDEDVDHPQCRDPGDGRLYFARLTIIHGLVLPPWRDCRLPHPDIGRTGSARTTQCREQRASGREHLGQVARSDVAKPCSGT